MGAMTKTPDQWEAEDLIKKMQARVEGNHLDDLCVIHSEALIWIIRRLDLTTTWPGLLLQIAKTSPAAILGVCLVLCCLILAKMNGVDIPWLGQ